MPDSALWTIHEAAAYLQLPISAIYKMTAAKARLRIPHVRIAGRLRFRRRDLDEWVELLTVSNLEVLRRTRKKGQQVFDGVNSQEAAPQR
jgi:excisionase family DNA binding protein